jgi:outer membrane cobalamin receptor
MLTNLFNYFPKEISMMKRILILLLSVVLLSGFNSLIYSQEEKVPVTEMSREQIMNLTLDELLELSMEDLMTLSQKLGISIDELLKMKTSVASKTALTPRETPGIISIITEEEIRNSGARDMIDILRLVPGFDFGYDVQGVVGVGLRGNWVHEGKILLMIDGQEINEGSYNNFAFGNHIPVDQIARVEIIRGPGSSIYGGAAELGVVNIITKTGEELKGVEASGVYGQMQNAMGHTGFNVNTGMKTDSWDFSAKGSYQVANRSDQPYYMPFDNNDTVDLSKGGSDIKSGNLNLGVTGKNLSARFIYDDYKTEYLYYDEELYYIFEEFRTILGELKYRIDLNDKLSITPKFNYKYSRPYYEEDYYRNFNVNRYVGNICMNYSANKKIDLVAGVEFKRDMGKMIEDDPDALFYATNSAAINLNNLAVYGEGLIKVKNFNIVAGGRVEQNSKYGLAAAPRVGATAIFNKIHFKALVSAAFRSPGVGNIDSGDDIKPENALVSEVEIGYRINDNMFITANLFDIKINKTIIYFDNGEDVQTPGIDWGYYNAESSGTDGFELEYRIRYEKLAATVNYSYYTLAYKSVPELYSVPGHEEMGLGLSPQKLAFSGSYLPLKNLYLSPSFSFHSKRYAYASLDDAGENPVLKEYDPYVLLNFSVGYANAFLKGLTISLTAFDLLNQRPYILQTYNGWNAPYPARSREIVLKLSLKLGKE